MISPVLNPSLRYDAIRIFRGELVKCYENSQLGLVNASLRDINDEVKIGEALGLDLALLAECSPLVYPRADSMFLSSKLYRELADIHRVQVDRLLKLINPRPIYIPPVLSIVLDRCKSREDFLDVLVDVRRELEPYREATRELERRISDEKQLSEQLDATQDYFDTVETLKRKIASPKRRVLQVVWDIVKEGGSFKMVTTALDKLHKSDLERARLKRITGFYDLWEASTKVDHYGVMLQRVFGPISNVDTPNISRAAEALHKLIAPGIQD